MDWLTVKIGATTVNAGSAIDSSSRLQSDATRAASR